MAKRAQPHDLAPLKPLQARVRRLEGLCAEIYQVAGSLGASVPVLDALWAAAAAAGKRIPRVSLLPYADGPGLGARGNTKNAHRGRALADKQRAARKQKAG